MMYQASVKIWVTPENQTEVKALVRSQGGWHQHFEPCECWVWMSRIYRDSYDAAYGEAQGVGDSVYKACPTVSYGKMEVEECAVEHP